MNPRGPEREFREGKMVVFCNPNELFARLSCSITEFWGIWRANWSYFVTQTSCLLVGSPSAPSWRCLPRERSRIFFIMFRPSQTLSRPTPLNFLDGSYGAPRGSAREFFFLRLGFPNPIPPRPAQFSRWFLAVPPAGALANFFFYVKASQTLSRPAPLNFLDGSWRCPPRKRSRIFFYMFGPGRFPNPVQRSWS